MRRATSTAATPTRPCGRSRRRSPSSRAPRTRSPSPRAWAPSPRRCSPSARPATTSSPSASSTPARSRSCRARAPGSASTTPSSTAPSPARSPRPCSRGARCSSSPRSPSNPRLDLVDLDELGAINGPFTVVDSTFATPLGQQPLATASTSSLHSATKGIAGHNDATLGVIAGERDLLDAIWAYCVLHGATPSPFDALNALRGIRTLAVRQRHQAAVALQVAEALRRPSGRRRRALPRAARPSRSTTLAAAPADVHADGAGRSTSPAASTPPARCSTRSASPARPRRSADRRRSCATPATSTHASLTPDEQAAIGITPGLLRISIGLEDADDIVADLERGHPGPDGSVGVRRFRGSDVGVEDHPPTAAPPRRGRGAGSEPRGGKPSG